MGPFTVMVVTKMRVGGEVLKFLSPPLPVRLVLPEVGET